MQLTKTLLWGVVSCLSLATPLCEAQGAEQLHRAHQIPIVFEPTAGNSTTWAKYGGRADGHTVLFGAAGLELHGNGQRIEQANEGLRIHFDHASEVQPHGMELEGSQTHYFLGNDPAQWRTGVKNFRKVAFRSLYPGVDAIFYGNGSALEHDFIVKAGADPGQIQLSFPRGAHLRMQSDGSLEAKAAGETVRLQAPVLYQEDGGKRIRREGRYRLLAKGAVGFRVGSYDHARDLVIDPVLNFATYLSSTAGAGTSVAVDAQGDTFVAGSSSDTLTPTAGAYLSCSGCSPSNGVSYVSKISPDGSKLLYTSVFGGNGVVQPSQLAVDSAGNAVVSGTTTATNFPQKNGQPFAPQNNNQLGFVLSLTADGAGLNYSTLLGSAPGSGYTSNTNALAVTLDPQGSAYVTGITGGGFPISAGALNDQDPNVSYPGDRFNAFLVKLGSTGTLGYSAILGVADPTNGGDGLIGPTAVAVDAAGEAYVSGQAGTRWTTTSGAYRNSIAGSMPYSAPFVSKVAADGKSLLYSTFLDGANGVAGVVPAADGSVLIAGNLPVASFPTTNGAFSNSGANGIFLARLNPNGTALQAATVFGDTHALAQGVAVAADGSVWLSGTARDSSYPLVLPVQGTYPQRLGGPVAVVSQFDATLGVLKFSTYLGGEAVVANAALAVDSKGVVHLAGGTTYGFLTTPNVLLPAVPLPAPGYSGTVFPFVASIDPAVSGPALCAAPNSVLGFQTTAVKGTSDASVTITSCGTQPLQISGVSSPDSTYSVPADQNNCLGSLAVGQSCKLDVRYAPTAPGGNQSSLKISSNASEATQSLLLSGGSENGAVLAASINALSFGPQLAGTTSTQQSITVTNQGSGPATNLQVSLNGDGAQSFQQSGQCGATLAVGASCTVTVVFAPKVAGNANADVSFLSTDDQTIGQADVLLAGTAPQVGFSLQPVQGANGSVTVLAGQVASFPLAVSAANGFKGNVSVSCGNLPQNASCTITPSSVSLAGGDGQTVQVSIATGMQTTADLAVHRPWPLLAFVLLPIYMRRRGRSLPILGLLLCLLGATGGCNSSGSSAGPAPTPTPTPTPSKVAPGTYAVQIAATDGVTKQTQAITLVVQ